MYFSLAKTEAPVAMIIVSQVDTHVFARLISLASTAKWTLNLAKSIVVGMAVWFSQVCLHVMWLGSFCLGICLNTSQSTFVCRCAAEWKGNYCELPMNYCENITCQHGGVCRSISGDYQCDCLSKSYSGRQCETKGSDIVVLQAVSQSFGYIAVTLMILVCTFIFALDILTYVFHIDPVGDERARRLAAAKRPRFAIRYLYIHEGGTPYLSRNNLIAETKV